MPSAPRRAPFWLVGLVACAGAPPAPAGPVEPPAAVDATTVVKLDAGGRDAKDDRDGDGIADAYDLCAGPLEDGRGAHPWDGCPDAADPARRATPWGVSPMLRMTRGAIHISQEVRFGSSSSAIDPASQELLRSVAQALIDVPEIELVEIAGHADDLGSPENNRKLTEARARSVLADLVGKRVARARLRAAGYSSFCPLAAGADETARAKNRRVEFRILRRDGKNLDPPWGGCDEAEKHGMKPAPLPPPTGPRTPGDDRKTLVDCSEAAAKACQKRCDGGEAAACEALANQLAADDPKRAFAAASRACTLGALHFCTRAAADLRAGRGVTKDAKRAHALVVGACERGNARACAQAGADLAEGSGEPKDAAKAFALYVRACDAGDASGCELAAAATWAGDGATKDRRKSLELTIGACELGSAKACATVATASAEEPALAKRSRGRALAALHVACEQDDAKEACDALGALREQPGEWQSAPLCAAGDFKACQKACDAAYASEPCFELGLALLYGTGVRRRSADALALFTESCREGNAKGCATAALVRASQDHDAKSERAAAADFDAACALGEASGCVNHALLELEGLGTYRDEASAASALDAACDKGEAIACAHVSRLAARGLGTAKDPARAAALLERACKGGFRPACPRPAAD
jgi:outer membrane protein OmpA-like peptidoglycan-associated protein